MHGDGVTVAVVTPEALEELLVGEDLAWMFCQQLQQFELARREWYDLAIHADLTCAHVQQEPSEVEGGGGRGSSRASQHRLYPCHYLTRRRGLHNVIVAAETQPANLVGVALLRAQEED